VVFKYFCLDLEIFRRKAHAEQQTPGKGDIP